MNVTVTDNTETRKDIVVSFDSQEIKEEEGLILKNFIKNARIPGFRQGKAPESIVRQKFKKEIQSELNSAVAKKAYQALTEKEDLDLFDIVDFPETGDIDANSETSIDLTVDIVPEFSLPEYKSIEVNLPSTDVSDEEIDETIERIRSQRADFEVVERAAEVTDYVKVSYEGKLGDELFADKLEEHQNLKAWGSVTDGWEEAGTDGAKQFGVPEIIDALVGMSKDEEKSVEQVLPDTFAIEDLRGKTVSYSLKVSEVRERKLPEVDEEFLKSVNAETLEDFKAQIMDGLEGQKKQQAEDGARQEMLNYLAEAVDFPLPQSGVEGETQQAMARIMTQNMQQGVAEEEFEKHKEELHATAAKTAARDVKLQIILNKIAKEESITVENEDLSKAVYAMAMQRRQKPEDLAKEIQKDRGQLLSLQKQVLFSKTLDLLRKEAKETIVVEKTES